MANETTTTSIAGLANQTTIEPVLVSALMERPGLARRICRKFSLVGKPGKVISIPKLSSYWGTTAPAERGAGVDLEFNGTEGTPTANTAATISGVSITCGTYSAAHAITFEAEEDSAIDPATLIGLLSGVMLKVLDLALDDDLIALFASLSNTIGSTGVDITIAQGLAATQGIIDRGTQCDYLEYTLDPEQVGNLRTAFLAAGATTAVYSATADKVIGFESADLAQRGLMGMAFALNGYPVFSNTLCDTANAGADVVGAAYAPSTPTNDANSATTYALCEKVFPQVGLQRMEKSGVIDLVLRQRYGVAELQDGSGSAVITDAP